MFASKVSEITNLGVDYLKKTFICLHICCWPFDKDLSIGEKNHPNLKFYNFPGDNKLCVCKAIDSYTERCKFLGVEETQFLVSQIKPHKPKSPSIVSRWLGQVLITTSITQSALCSKHKVSGVSLADTIKQSHWSQVATFQK